MPDELRELLKRKDADLPIKPEGTVFHATPASRVDSILKLGLQPRAENPQDAYTPRVYLAEQESQAVKLAFELRKALVHHQVVKRSWQEDYAVLCVATEPGESFWVDGYSAGGLYTDQLISADRIRLTLTIPGNQLLSRNWPRFWNRYFWQSA